MFREHSSFKDRLLCAKSWGFTAVEVTLPFQEELDINMMSESLRLENIQCALINSWPG